MVLLIKFFSVIEKTIITTKNPIKKESITEKVEKFIKMNPEEKQNIFNKLNKKYEEEKSSKFNYKKKKFIIKNCIVVS